MHEATIGDRASVERLYPREDFERDAGEKPEPHRAGGFGGVNRQLHRCGAPWSASAGGGAACAWRSATTLGSRARA